MVVSRNHNHNPNPNPTKPLSSSSSSASASASKIEKPSRRRKRAKTAHVNTANEVEQEENKLEEDITANATNKQSLVSEEDVQWQQEQEQEQQKQESMGRRKAEENNNPAKSSFKAPKGKTNSVLKPGNNRKRKATCSSVSSSSSSSSSSLVKSTATKEERERTGIEDINNYNNNNKKTLIEGSQKKEDIEIPNLGECSEEQKEEDEAAENAENAASSSQNPKPDKKRRKTKEEQKEEDMPLAARSAGLRFLIGAHVSAAKGVHNAVTNCLHIGGNAFALFLKSQRKWENPPLQDEHRVLFKDSCVKHKYEARSHILPHGSYLVNLAHEHPVRAKQSYDAFLDDLHRCEALGIGLYNFHPGAANSSERAPAIARIAAQLNASHAATSTVTTVLETMAGSGTAIGSTFNDLAEIIALINDKSRIGVCLDTCHIFAAGYDLRSREAFNSTLARFDAEIGLIYLKAVHLNDSKAPLGSRLDRHANIGTGFLGLSAFWNIMNDERFEGLPMVLETPAEDAAGKEDKGIYAREIKLLESLVGMERDGEEFCALEAEMARKGEAERKVAMEKFEKKEKGKAAKEKGKGKGKEKEKGQQKLGFKRKSESKEKEKEEDKDKDQL